MKSSKPLIGITGPDRGGAAAWWFTRLAVWLQGGRAVRITPSRTLGGPQIDGLILGGGADINPERYGQSLMDRYPGQDRPKPRGIRQWFRRAVTLLFYPIIFLLRKLFSTKSPTLDEQRDEIEFALLEEAVARNLPVLGICRGAQLMNIHFGGNLHQDIDTYYTEVPRPNTIWPEKMVEIEEGSRLQEVLKARKVWVNALHHQAVDTVGESLHIVAREENGIAQAIENPAHPFMVGVQWHPEYLPQIPRQRNLFKKLVEKAADVRRQK